MNDMVKLLKFLAEAIVVGVFLGVVPNLIFRHLSMDISDSTRVTILTVYIVFSVTLWMTLRRKKHLPEATGQEKIEENDERNIAVRRKACEFALVITFFLLIIASSLCVFLLEEFTVPYLILISVIVLSFVSFIAARAYYNKKM
jgi:uncharacterized membrane protein YbhN (UPF0104 family)